MAAKDDLEDRLTALELAVVEIQRRLGSGIRPGHWLDEFLGAFEDEPAFDQVVALGRELSRQDAPREDELAS